jgi:amidohydrolase
MFDNSPVFREWLVGLRRELHRHPELSLQEHRTTSFILDALGRKGVQASPLEGIPGAVGLWKVRSDDPVVALRADIDALPVEERNETAYRSERPGVMHACGHDANTAIMVGVAGKLVESGAADRLEGQVKFLFQPAEEKGVGAKAMIERGVLESPRVDRVLAGHMSPDLEVGQIGIFRGLGYASADRFELVVTGRGAHGARPEEGSDPVVAAAHFVTAAQTVVSRNVAPTDAAVVTVGAFKAGEAANVIPETARLEGSIRALSEDVRDRVIRRLEEMCRGLEAVFDVSCRFLLHEGVPVVVNDVEVAEFLHAVAAETVGGDNVRWLPPIMGSEDFSFFARQRPSCIIRLGCSNARKGWVHRLHSPRFDIDEDVLEIGVEVFYRAVRSFLSA